MMRPNFIGRKSLYLNPSNTAFTTAELNAIDTALTDQTVVSPYAYTATVRDDYDTANFFTDSAGVSAVAVGFRNAWGLFISPENDKKNLTWQVNGKVSLNAQSTSAVLAHGNFFFGRKATNNTVASSKASPSNQLAQFSILPSTSAMFISTNNQFNDSIETEIFSLELTAGFVYCFGYFIDNRGANVLNLNGMISLSMRKYNSEIGVFRPSR